MNRLLVTQSCLTLCNPMNCLPDTSVCSISQQKYWSGLPFPSPGDLLDPGNEPGSPDQQADSVLSEPPGDAITVKIYSFHFERSREFLLWHSFLVYLYCYQCLW